jgi:type IV pilus biogenesis protein CpaD/CtpE
MISPIFYTRAYPRANREQVKPMNKLSASLLRQSIASSVLLLVMATILGGCSSAPKDSPVEIQSQSFDALRDTAKDLISDPDQANEVTELITQLEGVILQTQNDRSRHRARIKALNANYDATEEEFTALLAGISDDQDASREAAIDIRRKLALAVPADDWPDLVKAMDTTRGESFDTLLSTD